MTAARDLGQRDQTRDPSDQTVVESCLQVLRDLCDGTAAFEPVRESSGAADRGSPDRVLRLHGSWGAARYIVAIRPRVTAETLGLVVQQLQALTATAGLPTLLLAEYVNPRLAEYLRGERLDFVDAAGNASLRRDALYVRVTGRRPAARAARATRAFQATGLRLVTLLLHHPEAVTWTYRALAAAAGVSLGSVGEVLADLKTAGYLRGTPPGGLVRRTALFARWELGYAETLRPRLWKATCRATGARTLEDLPRQIGASDLRHDVLVGGELGAALWTAHLRPARATLHLVRGSAERAMAGLRLLPDPAGSIEILGAVTPRQDWQGAGPADEGRASPFLVHAELLRGQPEGRLRETAAQLFGRDLAPLLADAPEGSPR